MDIAVQLEYAERSFAELPFYGSRRMTFELNKEGRGVNRKRVRRVDARDGDRGAGSPPRYEQSRASTPLRHTAIGVWLSIAW